MTNLRPTPAKNNQSLDFDGPLADLVDVGWGWPRGFDRVGRGVPPGSVVSLPFARMQTLNIAQTGNSVHVEFILSLSLRSVRSVGKKLILISSEWGLIHSVRNSGKYYVSPRRVDRDFPDWLNSGGDVDGRTTRAYQWLYTYVLPVELIFGSGQRQSFRWHFATASKYFYFHFSYCFSYNLKMTI
jgi:hypothetical protein